VKVTFLGTGTSHGVPMIGCDCLVCRSSDPRDKRLRPSIFVRLDDENGILVDAGPDLRQQALVHDLRRVDAILFTHGHADHILGIDETRRFNWTGSLPCFADAATTDAIRRMFGYVFDPATPKGGGLPQLQLTTIDGPFQIGGHEIRPIPLLHGERPILGFRFGAFAYLTDCNRVPDESWPLLHNLEVLVLDALRHRPHPTHFSLSESVETARRIAAQRTYFTHMCHDLGHEETNARLPEGMALAYDGLVIEIPSAQS
jgi:phosphoribosyl 1,2-cyclic phosphate phosphodiesterase